MEPNFPILVKLLFKIKPLLEVFSSLLSWILVMKWNRGFSKQTYDCLWHKEIWHIEDYIAFKYNLKLFCLL